MRCNGFVMYVYLSFKSVFVCVLFYLSASVITIPTLLWNFRSVLVLLKAANLRFSAELSLIFRLKKSIQVLSLLLALSLTFSLSFIVHVELFLVVGKTNF